jgi:hypothetical protein
LPAKAIWCGITGRRMWRVFVVPSPPGLAGITAQP